MTLLSSHRSIGACKDGVYHEYGPFPNIRPGDLCTEELNKERVFTSRIFRGFHSEFHNLPKFGDGVNVESTDSFEKHELL